MTKQGNHGLNKADQSSIREGNAELRKSWEHAASPESDLSHVWLCSCENISAHRRLSTCSGCLRKPVHTNRRRPNPAQAAERVCRAPLAPWGPAPGHDRRINHSWGKHTGRRIATLPNHQRAVYRQPRPNTKRCRPPGRVPDPPSPAQSYHPFCRHAWKTLPVNLACTSRRAVSPRTQPDLAMSRRRRAAPATPR